MIIDKSHVLKAGLEKFPSIFIEGAAVIGKTTAVNMLLEAHPEATSDVFNMNKKIDIDAFSRRLREANAKAKGERFLVFENILLCKVSKILKRRENNGDNSHILTKQMQQ